MKVIRIPLEPHSHFHFGEFKIDSNVALSSTSAFMHSDTLFSAMVNTCAKVDDHADSFVKLFKQGSINISSLFYYLKKDDVIVYLLPKPGFIDIFSPQDGNHKLRAKVNMVSLGVWEKGFETKAWTDSENYRFLQNQEIILTSEEFDMIGLREADWIYNIIDIPKNPIRKMNETDSIYYQADVEIGKIEYVEIGFYLFFDSNLEFNENELKKIVQILRYSGIGGEKNNTGRTMQEPVMDDVIMKISDDPTLSEGFTNVSLLNPEEPDLSQIEYSQTLLRGGGHNGKEILKVVRMIKEGALFKSPKVKGRMVAIGTDLDENTVLRNGRAFNVKIKYKTHHD